MRNNNVVNGKMCWKIISENTGRQIVLKISEIIAKTFGEWNTE
jgi:hypothetical protein